MAATAFDPKVVPQMLPDAKARLKAYIISHEGWRTEPYLDVAGLPTIGVGFNLTKSGARERILDLGCGADDWRALKLTDEQVQRLFDEDFETALDGAVGLVDGFDRLSEARQGVLVDMAFHMGVGGLSRFSRTLAAVQAGDWDRAAAEMLDSRYALQTPARAQRNIEAMRRGQWPDDRPTGAKSDG
jgi:lysozyme